MADLAIAAASLLVLAFASGQFVQGAARVAAGLGVSQLLIGAVLLGVGTSLPDGLVSGIAAARGDPGIALGNVFGSNAFNIAVALGVAALITPLAIGQVTLRREAVLATAATLGVLAVAAIGLGPAFGAVLALLVVPAVWVMSRAPEGSPEPPEPPEPPEAGSRSLPFELGRALLGLAFTVAGSRFLVTSAEEIALDVGVSEATIGVTLVAIGTSIPELAVSVQAARQRAADLVIGNVLGSNLINSLGVAGVAALLSPRPIELDGLGGAGILMAALTVTAFGLLATGRKLVRWEGAALLGAYLVALPLLA